MILQKLRSRRGSGMIIGFFVLMLVFTLGMSFLVMSSQSVMTSKRDVLRARALAAAEAGVDQAMTYLLTRGPSNEASGDWRNHPAGSLPDDHSADTLCEGSLNANESYRVCARTGSGPTAGKVVITSIGTVTEGNVPPVHRTIKVVVDYNLENVNVWNNVIFGGVGQAGKSIQGNVVMRGSIHLLGDGEDYTDVDNDGHWDDGSELLTWVDKVPLNGLKDPGEWIDFDGDGRCDAREPFKDVNGNGTRDPALTVTDIAQDINGTANVGNNYSGMSNLLKPLLPNPPQDTFGGETVDTLSAKLRVKHGRVNVSGSATVGDPNVAGNTVKETMNGTFVSDGFGGNAGAGAVSSDNGTNKAYDLGEGLVDMPVIDSQGGPVTIGGTVYASYLDYLKATSTVVAGDLDLSVGTARSIVGPNGSLTIDASGNMTITGKVYVTGNLSFGNTNKSTITYEGSGTLVTQQSTFVHCNILPKTNFPLNDVLGLIAADRIELATGGGDAQLTMALAMYAQHRVISQKQSEIAGTMVSSYYQMSNVPRIYQVPELANHLPPGMPGSEPIWIKSLTVESWQEI